MIHFFSQKFNSNFETYEMAPGIYEVSDIKNTSENLMKDDVSVNFITRKSQLKANNVLRSHEKSRFTTIFGFSPQWDYQPNIENNSRNKI